MNSTLEQRGNVVTMRVDGISSGDTIPLMLSSDWHFDSVKCDRNLLTRHLTRANQDGAVVLVAGDVFDAMQGRFDPRKSYTNLREEYKVADYYDAIADDAAVFLSQFNRCKFILAMGNHETAVLKNASTHLINTTAKELRHRGIEAFNAGYYGWLHILSKDEHGKGRAKQRIYWHHGHGGNAPVTRGVISTNRQAVFLRNADIVLNGHNHQQYHVTIKEYGLTIRGQEYTSVVHYLRTPGYKMSGLENGDEMGYDIEKHPEPLPRGSAFVDLRYGTNGQDFDVDVLMKVE